MIRMLKGNYGLAEGDTVRAVTPKDEPFETDKAKEEELVASGFAEKVKKPAQKKPAAAKKAESKKEEGKD